MFFEVKKPRQFNYKPRFYDPEKEELENLKAKYGEKTGESYKRKIDFRQAMESQRKKKIGKPSSFLRVILIACVILILIYVFLTFIAK